MEGIEKLQNKADSYRYTANLIKRVKPIFIDFDKKVYNKNFDKAISDLTDDEIRFSAYHAHDNKWFYVNWSSRSSHYNNPSILCVPGCLAGRFNDFYSRKDSIFDEDKRINKDKALVVLNENYASLLKRATEYEFYIDNAEYIINQVEYARKLFDKIISPIPYDIREDLKICRRF